MATGPYFYLHPDEELLLAQRPGVGYAFQVFAALSFPALVIAGVVGAFLPAYRGLVLAALLLLVTAAGLLAWRRWATSEYAVTDQRLYARHGQLVISVHFTTHDKVTDLLLSQGPIQRALGVSTLVFSTAGGDVRMSGVRDALKLKERAEAARDAFLSRLLERAGVERQDRARETREAPPTGAPAEIPAWSGARPDYLKTGDEPAWTARPLPVSAITAARSLVGLVPVAFWLYYTRGLAAAPLALALVGFALLFVAIRLLQLRRTEYFATDRRVYARSGVLGTTVTQLTYDKITDITYHQDVIGRLLGYGAVTLSTAGGGNAPIVMRGLRDALAAKETVERLREGYLREDR